MGKTPNCLIFALLALCSSLSVQSVSGQEKLRIAWSGSSPAHTPIWVVEERNLLKKYGIDPNHGMPALDIHEEVTMFVEAGLTPMQAIQAATINVAKTFAKGRDFGTLEPGKFADIIMVDGNPLKDSWATQNVKLVISAGRVIDHNFHSDYKNPIPSPEPWRNIPREIEVTPRSIPQGSRPAMMTVKATAGRMARWHKIAIDGKLLETRFVSSTELQGKIPPQAIKKAGTYPVTVVSPRESGGRSQPAHLIVTFRR